MKRINRSSSSYYSITYNILYVHNIPLAFEGCWKREAHINWSMVKYEKASPVTYSNYLEDYWHDPAPAYSRQ